MTTARSGEHMYLYTGVNGRGGLVVGRMSTVVRYSSMQVYEIPGVLSIDTMDYGIHCLRPSEVLCCGSCLQVPVLLLVVTGSVAVRQCGSAAVRGPGSGVWLAGNRGGRGGAGLGGGQAGRRPCVSHSLTAAEFV